MSFSENCSKQAGGVLFIVDYVAFYRKAPPEQHCWVDVFLQGNSGLNKEINGLFYYFEKLYFFNKIFNYTLGKEGGEL